MPNGFKVKIDSISTDGTNLFFTISVFNGAHTLPPITPVFDDATTAAQIDTYMQTIVDNGASLPAAMVPLVGKIYTGA